MAQAGAILAQRGIIPKHNKSINYEIVTKTDLEKNSFRKKIENNFIFIHYSFCGH